MTALAEQQELHFRAADQRDAQAVAALHADSWRQHYRGAYSDAFLDGDLVADRLAVWSSRLSESAPASKTILSEHAGGLVGFVHVIYEGDWERAALIDNLHVVRGLKRRGIGSRLLTMAAAAVRDRSASSEMYLWVLEQNADAQAFYSARGGLCVGREATPPPGGDPARLRGKPVRLRYLWSDPAMLLADPAWR